MMHYDVDRSRADDDEDVRCYVRSTPPITWTWAIETLCVVITTVIAIGAVLVLLIVAATASVSCASSPDRTPGMFWRYRVVDGMRCWYRGDSILPKSELTWAPAVEHTVEFGDKAKANPLVPNRVQTISYRLEGEQKDPAFEPWKTKDTIAIIFGTVGLGLIVFYALLWPIFRLDR